MTERPDPLGTGGGEFDTPTVPSVPRRPDTPQVGTPPLGDPGRYPLGEESVGTQPVSTAPVGTSGSSTGGASSTGGSSTTDVAKEQAAQVKDTAVSAGQNVAGTAKDEAGKVARETKAQAQGLLDTVGSELRGQANNQQQRLATAVHSWSKELGGMASASKESGPLTDLAQQASARGGEIAHWLEDREPRDVLDEVRSFARRRPVMFLGVCALAGVVVGRLTRGAVAANTQLDSSDDGRSASEPRALSTTSFAEPPSYGGAPETATGRGYQPGVGEVPPAGPSYVGPATTGPVSGGYPTTGTTAAGNPGEPVFDDPLLAPEDPMAPGRNRPDELR